MRLFYRIRNTPGGCVFPSLALGGARGTPPNPHPPLLPVPRLRRVLAADSPFWGLADTHQYPGVSRRCPRTEVRGSISSPKISEGTPLGARRRSSYYMISHKNMDEVYSFLLRCPRRRTSPFLRALGSPPPHLVLPFGDGVVVTPRPPWHFINSSRD